MIGPGGRVIRSIIEETGCSVDIEDDGTVFIGSPNEEQAQKAISIIEGLTKEVELGEIYTGTVSRLTNFGAFVEILPGKDGLVRVEDLSDDAGKQRPKTLSASATRSTVMVIEVDSMGRVNLSRRAVARQDDRLKRRSKLSRADAGRFAWRRWWPRRRPRRSRRLWRRRWRRRPWPAPGGGGGGGYGDRGGRRRWWRRRWRPAPGGGGGFGGQRSGGGGGGFRRDRQQRPGAGGGGGGGEPGSLRKPPSEPPPPDPPGRCCRSRRKPPPPPPERRWPPKPPPPPLALAATAAAATTAADGRRGRRSHRRHRRSAAGHGRRRHRRPPEPPPPPGRHRGRPPPPRAAAWSPPRQLERLFGEREDGAAREVDAADGVDLDDHDRDLVAEAGLRPRDGSTVSSARSSMWTRPSLPGRISTKAPKLAGARPCRCRSRRPPLPWSGLRSC